MRVEESFQVGDHVYHRVTGETGQITEIENDNARWTMDRTGTPYRSPLKNLGVESATEPKPTIYRYDLAAMSEGAVVTDGNTTFNKLGERHGQIAWLDERTNTLHTETWLQEHLNDRLRQQGPRDVPPVDESGVVDVETQLRERIAALETEANTYVAEIDALRASVSTLQVLLSIEETLVDTLNSRRSLYQKLVDASLRWWYRA